MFINVGKSIELGDWFGLHEDTHVGIDDGWGSTVGEKDGVELSGEKSVDLLQLDEVLRVHANLWELGEHPA